MKLNRLLLLGIIFTLTATFGFSQSKPYAHLKTGCSETVAIKTLEGNTLAVSQEGYTVVSYEITFETKSGKQTINIEGDKITPTAIAPLKMKKPAQVWITNIKLKDSKGNISDSADMGFNVTY